MRAEHKQSLPGTGVENSPKAREVARAAAPGRERGQAGQDTSLRGAVWCPWVLQVLTHPIPAHFSTLRGTSSFPLVPQDLHLLLPSTG